MEWRICVQFLRLLRLLRFGKTAKTAETAKTAYAILSTFLLYLPFATCWISLQLMLFCNQRSIVLLPIPRTSACFTASCLVKSVGSIWKNWRWSIISPTGVVRVETWITPCLRQKSYKSYGNYMRVNTTTDNVTWVMWINNSNNFSNNFRSNQLLRAAQNMIQGVNRYINPNKKRHQ